MIKQIGPEEYKEICGWWTAHGFPVIPQEALPQTGWVASLEGLDTAAGFLQLPRLGNGFIGWLEFLVANPEANQLARTIAIKEVVQHIVDVAKTEGMKVLFTSADGKKTKFHEKLEQSGFQKRDENVTHFSYNIS